MDQHRTAEDVSAPYRLLKPVDASGAQAAYRKHLAESLSPLLTEVVSQQTRQLQQQLLVVAAFLVLTTFSLISITGQAEWNGVKLRVVANAAVGIAFSVTLYLELLVAVRSHLDWSAWRIQAGAAQIRLEQAVRDSFVHAPLGAQETIDSIKENAEALSDRYRDDGQALSDDELKLRTLHRRRGTSN